MRRVMMPMRMASRVRILRLFFRAARTGGICLDVLLGRGRELGFAAGTAEQYLFAIMREPMGRIRFDTRAADGVALVSAWVSVVFVMMMGDHVVLASSLALLISLAPEFAPSHNGKVNTENWVPIP
jgi:hypothetical protein